MIWTNSPIIGVYPAAPFNTSAFRFEKPQISEPFWCSAGWISLSLMSCHMTPATLCKHLASDFSRLSQLQLVLSQFSFQNLMRITCCYLLSSFLLSLSFMLFKKKIFTVILAGLWEQTLINTCVNLLGLSRISRVIVMYERLPMGY